MRQRVGPNFQGAGAGVGGPVLRDPFRDLAQRRDPARCDLVDLDDEKGAVLPFDDVAVVASDLLLEDALEEARVVRQAADRLAGGVAPAAVDGRDALQFHPDLSGDPVERQIGAQPVVGVFAQPV